MFEASPMLGSGLGSSQEMLAPLQDSFIEHQGTHFHSSYLTSLVEIGGLGTAVLAFILIVTFVVGLRNIVRRPSLRLPWAIMVGALVHGAFESWFLAPGNANTFIFWVLIFVSSSPVRDKAFQPDMKGQESVHC
jgi:O-antigen ligase